MGKNWDKMNERELLAEIARRRDEALQRALIDYRPVWLVFNEMEPESKKNVFNVVFRHPRRGWVNRRYLFDAFDEVLYERGEYVISEEKAIDIQATTPHLT